MLSNWYLTPSLTRARVVLWSKGCWCCIDGRLYHGGKEGGLVGRERSGFKR